MDTTRYDAMSANGNPAPTTPVFDRLAAAGLRYATAYAQANWTVPSHASLFTGLLPRQHGMVGLQGRLPDDVTTIAQRLGAAGYETVGITENAWLQERNGLARGFERFTVLEPEALQRGDALLGALKDWLAARAGDRPFFLFVNVMDAHWEYKVRAENPFLPSGVDAAAASAVPQEPSRYLCQRDPHTRELAVLHGLYLGGVAAADRKLGQVLEQLRAAPAHDPLVTVVTSDHGEHFGEHRLVSHNFGIYEELIHVPLVVHGLPGAPPGVVRDAVQLADIAPSVLEWCGLPLPAGIASRPLPFRDGADPRPVFAEYTELQSREKIALPAAVAHLILTRDACTPEDRLFGDMEAVIDYPRKLVRYADGSTALYDLSVDPGELHDRTPEQPAVVARLAAELAASAVRFPRHAGDASRTLDPALAERLHALGYIGR